MSGLMREINIRPVLNGFIAHVGCQTLVFTDIESLCEQMKLYHANPDAMQESYSKTYVNPTLAIAVTCNPCMAAAPSCQADEEVLPEAGFNRGSSVAANGPLDNVAPSVGCCEPPLHGTAWTRPS